MTTTTTTTTTTHARTRRGSWLLLFSCAQCDAMSIHTFPRSHACACSSTLPRAPPVTCKDEPVRTLQAGEVIGYALLLNFFSTPLTVFLTQRGLITPPPFNTFTAIANKAMEEAIANGEIDKLMGTMYGQQKWYGFIGEYFASGETTSFMTATGGLCDQHPAWCEGITIPLTGGVVPLP